MGSSLALLSALQQSDSFFPGGNASFSWGVESLHTDGEVASAAALAEFVEGQLRHRWASCDLRALTAAFRADGRLDRVADVDAILEAMALAAELREGSRRAGTSLLNVHARLGTAGAADYLARIGDRRAFGHLAVVQGLVWRASGMTEEACRAVSAHTLCTGMVGAALRMGMIGHLDAQKVLLRIRPVLVDLLENAADVDDELHAYSPQVEIAAMRHESQDCRLFAN